MPDPITADQNQNPTPPAFPEIPDIPNVQEIANTTPQMSGSSEITDIPPITTNSKPPKSHKSKLIATILGVLLLVGSIGTGVALVSQNQDIRNEACENANCLCPDPKPDNISCIHIGEKYYVDITKEAGCIFCNWSWDGHECKPPTSPSPTATPTATPIPAACNELCNGFANPQINCQAGLTCHQAIDTGWKIITGDGPGVCRKQDCPEKTDCLCESNTPTPTPTATPTTTPTPTPTVPPGEASCSSVKAYDTDWSPLNATQLSALRAGDIVRFTISGTPADQIDMARFTVEAGVQSGVSGDITQKKTGTDEYYFEYTIPAGVSSFTVTAQVHHLTLGWF